MKFIDLIKLATRMFKARTSRTFLTILGIGVGMATILFLISLGFGVQRVILNKMTTSNSLSSIDIYPNSAQKKEINWKAVEQISYIKGIEKIAPLLKYDGQIKIEKFSSNTSFLITSPDYIGMDGKTFIIGDDLSSAKKNGVVLTSSFLKVFNNRPEDLMGQYVDIYLQIPSEKRGQFIEKKIEAKLEIIGIIENEKSNVYVNLDAVKNLDLNNIYSIKAKAQNFNQVDGIKIEIESLGFKTSSVSEIIGQTKKFFSLASLVLVVLGIIALGISSIGMFNTMVITLLERTEEIGIMKSIGATDRNILSIFIFEASVIGLLGGISGVIIGFLAQLIFNFIINFIAVRMGGEAFDLFYSPVWFVALLIIISFLIGIFTGLIPARKASKIDPLEALKRR